MEAIMSDSVDRRSNETTTTTTTSTTASSVGTGERVEGTTGTGHAPASTGVAVLGGAAAAATMTMTVAPPQTTEDGEVLRLTLINRPAVTWDENVVDNEGMGRKSSKRCCIFHKQRAFGESSTDTSDYDSDDGKGDRKIARKKPPSKKKTPDHLRFHA